VESTREMAPAAGKCDGSSRPGRSGAAMHRIASGQGRVSGVMIDAIADLASKSLSRHFLSTLNDATATVTAVREDASRSCLMASRKVRAHLSRELCLPWTAAPPTPASLSAAPPTNIVGNHLSRDEDCNSIQCEVERPKDG
jgi:hypothetical protein